MQDDVRVNTISQETKQETEFEKIICRLACIDDLVANRSVDFQEIRHKIVGGNTSHQEFEKPKEECQLAVIYHYLDRIDYSLKSMMETVHELNRIV